MAVLARLMTYVYVCTYLWLQRNDVVDLAVLQGIISSMHPVTP